jgi:hypothetical protein
MEVAMSRSFKRNPAGGFTNAKSERQDKQSWHRRFRRWVHRALSQEEEVMPEVFEASSDWDMRKDGKKWFGGDEGREKIAASRAIRFFRRKAEVEDTE